MKGMVINMSVTLEHERKAISIKPINRRGHLRLKLRGWLDDRSDRKKLDGEASRVEAGMDLLEAERKRRRGEYARVYDERKKQLLKGKTDHEIEKATREKSDNKRIQARARKNEAEIKRIEAEIKVLDDELQKVLESVDDNLNVKKCTYMRFVSERKDGGSNEN